MMKTFRSMVNDCIKLGMENDVATLKKLSKLAYQRLAEYDILSYYRLCAISHAAGILANRKKSLKRGLAPRTPYSKRSFLLSCYGFKIANGILKIPLRNGEYFDIMLNSYVMKVLSDPSLRVRSFTLTASNTVSICVSKEVMEMECISIQGIDRNMRNLTVGNEKSVVQYDLARAVDIAENTRSIVKSFKRNDVRIRRKVAINYGLRRRNRVNQLLHNVSKAVVQKAKQDKLALAFENIIHIRKLYQRGNGQGRNYRSKLNGWSFAEIKRQIEYKAAWEGVPVIQLSRSETRGTSQLCPRCGKKITQVDRHTRQLWCDQCKKWMDRDVVAAMNLSIKGLARFASSKGLADEAMKGNVEKEPLILRVDASKLVFLRRLIEPKFQRSFS
ncbi:MAG: zinc ribbon domain-containing protein, partial [Nitrososphaera sp.]